MVASPTDCGVMRPVDKPIVAIPVSDDDHVPPETLLTKVVVLVEHISNVPLKVPVFGAAVIVITRIAVALGQASSPATV